MFPHLVKPYCFNFRINYNNNLSCPNLKDFYCIYLQSLVLEPAMESLNIAEDTDLHRKINEVINGAVKDRTKSLQVKSFVTWFHYYSFPLDRLLWNSGDFCGCLVSQWCGVQNSNRLVRHHFSHANSDVIQTERKPRPACNGQVVCREVFALSPHRLDCPAQYEWKNL